MAEEKHIIRRLIVELYLPSQEEAFRIQYQASSFVKEKLLPVIEKVVDELTRHHEVIRIDRLELDLEQFVPGELNDDTLRKFEENIRERVIQLVQKERSEQFAAETITAVTKSTSQESAEELFLYILATGSLPWWARSSERVSMEQLSETVFSDPSPGFRSLLAKAVKDPRVRKRIAVLTDNVHQHIFRFVFDPSGQLGNHVAAMRTFISRTFVLTHGVTERFIERLFSYDRPALPHMRIFLTEELRKNNDPDLAQRFYTESKKFVQAELKRTVLFSLEGPTEAEVKKLFTDSEEEYPVEAIRGEEKLPAPEEGYNEIFNAEREGDHFIGNAGVIILAVYLPHLFRELGLCEGKEFVSTEARERAVHLIQFLSDGTEEGAEEHDMVLNKILCGMDVSEPLTLPFIISEREKEECFSLLTAVAGHWTALKNTTGQGMREAFFSREGILERQQNGWNLKIEKITIDILLDKLPWGISIVQMPWSSDMIFVSW